ncbi:MAG: TIGR03618 family F420-dependent PPOX class oxidoreductase [SAR202 cluster bacterium]|nr:TIGR03618 family F420-dependent PPOX class oxidoreductase [SAR202 cluster bacterium]|tara:strand:+ start:63 stop:473 length:411 start_codon:yes stop_codon:yes gene_type:complete
MINLSKSAESLVKGKYLADLVTLMPDGSPHIAPVWYKYDGENYLILSEPKTVKVRNIEHDNRVAILISKTDPPYSYVMFNGHAKISDCKDEDLLMELSIKYLGEIAGDKYANEIKQTSKFILITFTPQKVVEFFDS